jgi:diketogulonate reductase-like aldo/keto reductase
MRTITTTAGTALSPIGIGTYGIGGRGHRDVGLRDLKPDAVYIEALINQFAAGYNFSEISLGYGHGNAAKLFAQALRSETVERKSLFITNSLYPRDLVDFATVVADIESIYDLLDFDYFDSTLVTQSLIVKFGYEQVVAKLWELLESGRSRYVSLSNSNRKLIQQFKSEFKDKLFAHETHISFEVRECQDEGIFAVSNELDVQTIIWRPLRQGKTAEHNWPILKQLSEKYDKTQNQIVLNWMGSLGFKPEVFSTSLQHIHENWEAMQFTMEPAEYLEITNHRIPNYSPPKINWDNMGNGDSIVPLVMGFEENYN